MGIQSGLEEHKSNSERLAVLTDSSEGVDWMGRERSVILRENEPRITYVIVNLLTLQSHLRDSHKIS